MSAILSFIRSRYSVRKYKEQPVPEELIKQLIEAARWAPSAGNLQPWFFYVVVRDDIKGTLASAAKGQKFIERAPVCIVVCVEPERSARVYGDRGRNLFCYQDTAAAVQNMLLTASGLGLGACWVGIFDQEPVQSILNIPPDRYAVALITLGFPDDDPSRRPRRREVEEMTHWVV